MSVAQVGDCACAGEEPQAENHNVHFFVCRLNWASEEYIKIESNLNSSNTNGLFTMANSNSFLSPYEILPIAQENKYLRKLSYFLMRLYVVVCSH